MSNKVSLLPRTKFRLFRADKLLCSRDLELLGREPLQKFVLEIMTVLVLFQNCCSRHLSHWYTVL